MFPVASVSIVQNGKLLMVQECKKENYGKWNIPSGRPEPGEDIMHCAIREAQEETGYQVELTGITGIYSFTSETKSPLVRFNFTGNIIGGDINFEQNEILDVKWFSFDQIDQLKENELWNAHSIRQIVEDIKRGSSYSNDILKSC